jgi:hypothetical protein
VIRGSFQDRECIDDGSDKNGSPADQRGSACGRPLVVTRGRFEWSRLPLLSKSLQSPSNFLPLPIGRLAFRTGSIAAHVGIRSGRPTSGALAFQCHRSRRHRGLRQYRPGEIVLNRALLIESESETRRVFEKYNAPTMAVRRPQRCTELAHPSSA